MAVVRLKIPVIAAHSKVEKQNLYVLRPLFTPYPSVSNRRLELATARFRDEIRQYFKGFVLERSNADTLLWYLFNPEVTYHAFDFNFRSGDVWVDGRFGVVSFELQELTFAFLPTMNYFMFLVQSGKTNRAVIQKRTEQVLKRLLTDLKKEEKEDFDLQRYYSTGRELLMHVEANVNVNFGKFQHELDPQSWIFARLREEADFDGATEVERTSTDLNSRYPAELGRAFYQDELVERIYRIIFQPENTPIVLVGSEGVGKRALVYEVVWRYQSDFYEPKKGEPEIVWHLDPTRVISGMSVVGMWQKRMEAIIRYLINPNGDGKKSDKLLIDNPVALLRVGKSAQNNLTLSDVLKTYLEKRKLQLVLIATPEEWKIVQEKDRSFADLFQVFRIQEPDLETTTKIVLAQRNVLERDQGCTFTIQAIHQIFTIQRNFYRNQALPGSVMKMLRQLAAKYRFSAVDAPQVREEFKALSGLEDRVLDPQGQWSERPVETALAEELVGQPRAVTALANVVHLVKAKLVDKSKPVSSFLFIGPTGVGKTQAAKILCNYLLGDESYLLRFDMNEFIDGGAVARLIGDFYNPEGQLTGKVRYRPFGVLLLDEIEKAHPKVHDLLLQLLDEGRLTDSLGRTVDFSNTIIVMTSNLGAREIGQQLGFNSSAEAEDAIYRKAVENFFRPEFVNRIDEIVIFNPLELDHILNIARLQIKELLQRDGFVRRTTILNISKEALQWVARRGYDGRMGGRALKRQIERDLTTLSAEQLIATHTEQPILFDITLEEDRLVPRITPLDFIFPLEEDWLPHLPHENKGKAFYGKLLQSVERLEQHIAQAERRSTDFVMVQDYNNWQYYDFKNKVAEMKEKLRDRLLRFRDRYMHEAPALPLRLKPGNIVPRREDGAANRAIRENFRDRLFQEEALRELREAYQFSSSQFDTVQTDFINHYLDVAFLLLAARGFLQQQSDRIILQLESLITGLGSWEIYYLLDQYANLLQALDIPFEKDSYQFTIHAEGHSLYELLHGEAGIHLFYIAHQNPLPIRLTVQRADTSNGSPPLHRVIRIYDGSSTLTDLRSGFSNMLNMTANELKLLVYAGLAAEVRSDLIKH
jgi:ATP-dependent Clp protease ATP-binding subunit ClpC